MFMALSYAFDPPETKGLMKLAPRKPVTDESMLKRKLALDPSRPKPSLIEKLMAPTDGETLVDNGLLSWSYLEAGTIMSLGCFVGYFFALYYEYKITLADCVKYGSSWGANGTITLANGDTLVYRN